jgi:hypothetical protein
MKQIRRHQVAGRDLPDRIAVCKPIRRKVEPRLNNARVPKQANDAA